MGLEPGTFSVNSLDAYSLDYESNVEIGLNFKYQEKVILL